MTSQERFRPRLAGAALLAFGIAVPLLFDIDGLLLAAAGGACALGLVLLNDVENGLSHKDLGKAAFAQWRQRLGRLTASPSLIRRLGVAILAISIALGLLAGSGVLVLLAGAMGGVGVGMTTAPLRLQRWQLAGRWLAQRGQRLND